MKPAERELLQSKGVGRNEPVGLISDARGASAAEYAIALALVSLVALGAWSLLGQSVDEQVDCTVRAITAGDASCRGVRATPSRGALARAPESLLSGARPARSGLSADREYASRFERALVALSDARTFELLSGGDDRVTRADLDAVGADPSRYDAATRDAAAFLLGSGAALHALDVAHRGAVDGEMSLDDARDLRREIANHDPRALAQLLADTAAGRGGRDHQWSQDDLDALARDTTVPDSIASWATHATPNASRGCPWYRVDCAAGHAASSAWSASSGARRWGTRAAGWVTPSASSVQWGLGLRERLAWATQLAPPLDPRRWDDYARFRVGLIRGAVDWTVGTGEGLAAIGAWIVEPGDHHIDLGRIWQGVESMPAAYWHQLDTFAVGDPEDAGRAGGSLALDAASMVVPVGAPIKGLRVARSAGRASTSRRGPIWVERIERDEAVLLPPPPEALELAREMVHPAGTATAADAEVVVQHLARRFPPSILRTVRDRGTTIYVGRGHISDIEAVRGFGPPWSNSTVAGLYDARTNRIFLAVEERSGGGRGIHAEAGDAVAHEIGHSFDVVSRQPLAFHSETEAFRTAFGGRTSGGGMMHRRYSEEFASSFASYYGGRPAVYLEPGYAYLDKDPLALGHSGDLARRTMTVERWLRDHEGAVFRYDPVDDARQPVSRARFAPPAPAERSRLVPEIEHAPQERLRARWTHRQHGSTFVTFERRGESVDIVKSPLTSGVAESMLRQPSGSAGSMLADALRAAEIPRPATIRISGVQPHQPALLEIAHGVPVYDSELGVTLRRTIADLGGDATELRFGVDRSRAWIEVDATYPVTRRIRSYRPRLPRRQRR